MAIGDVPLTPIIDTVTGSVTEIGRIFLRTLSAAVGALAPIDAAYWTSRAAGVLSAEVNLGALASGYLKIATAVGIATPSTVPTIPQADVSGLPAALAGAAQLAGGNSFTGNQTIAGVVTVTGFGAHTVTAGGLGGHSLTIRNTTAGSNYAQLAVGNDVTAQLGSLFGFASTYPASADAIPSGVTLRGTGSGGLTLSTSGATALRFVTSLVERIRILGTGELLINTPTALAGFVQKIGIAFDGAAGSAIVWQNANAGNTGNLAVFLNSAGGVAGYINQTAALAVNYNTTSDARLKTDAGRATDLSALRALVVHDFRWKADGARDRGVFAQEAAALFPRAITPGTDATTAAGALVQPWAADYSKFVADLIVGWQQHETEIATLRAAIGELVVALAKGSRADA
jgi:hypothetical protein